MQWSSPYTDHCGSGPRGAEESRDGHGGLAVENTGNRRDAVDTRKKERIGMDSSGGGDGSCFDRSEWNAVVTKSGMSPHEYR